jgi:protein-S-isoprenylcysteine O-methyltransferase Ste14
VVWTWLPLVGITLFLGMLVWRAWWQRRRYGSRAVLLFQSPRRVERLRDAAGAGLVLVLVGQAVVAAVQPTSVAPLLAAGHPAATVARGAGAALLFGGIALVAAAQLALGASWRIGIEDGSRPGLVTSGLYRVCRNPIFLGILVMLAGYTLLLTTWLSLALLVGAAIGMRRQALTEETHLARAYGEAYRAYARRVGRFVPGIGRLR